MHSALCIVHCDWTSFASLSFYYFIYFLFLSLITLIVDIVLVSCDPRCTIDAAVKHVGDAVDHVADVTQATHDDVQDMQQQHEFELSQKLQQVKLAPPAYAPAPSAAASVTSVAAAAPAVSAISTDPVPTWNVDNVCAWLAAPENDMAQYIPAFRARKINGARLLGLSAELLNKLGVTDKFHILAIQTFQQQHKQ